MCDLLPDGLVDDFQGEWQATVNGKPVEIVYIVTGVNNRSRAILKIDDDSELLGAVGQLTVTCVFLDKHKKPVLEFNRTVDVIRECFVSHTDRVYLLVDHNHLV